MIVKESKLLSKSLSFGHDVWYRKFLKPLTSQNKSITYKVAFQRRVVRTVGIPVTDIRGFHEIFVPEYRFYSPLQGMLFAHNNFIDNLFRYGQEDALVQLVRELFHVLPGGEIQVTHVGRKTGAHLTSSIIGDILVAWEDWKNENKSTAWNKEVEDQLSTLIMNLLEGHPEFRSNREELKGQVDKAREYLEALEKQEEEAALDREEIKRLEGDIIKVARRDAKKLRKQLKKIKDEEEKNKIEKEAEEKELLVEETEAKVSKLREKIVTSVEFKMARKALKRAEDALTLEQGDRHHFVLTLVKCLFTYDADSSAPRKLPHYSTTAVLLAYLWRKYDAITSLEGYFNAMHRLGALNVSSDDLHKMLDKNTLAKASLPPVPYRHRNWSDSDVAMAAAITSGKPNEVNRPTVIPFSYITWAAYSEFPDCGETALRNLMNQMFFNPDTGKFDYELLQELKETNYPNMSNSLIEFYKQNDDPQNAAEPDTAIEWIEVVSYLNDGRSGDNTIRYRREKEQKNIASPLKNLLRVFNALFGVEDLNCTSVLNDVVDNINNIRNFNLEIDLSGIKSDGFGTVSLTDSKVRYELQSYKPVHFGFVQVEALQTGKAGRDNFNVFCNLMQHSCNAPTDAVNTTAFFEQLALASLFVPYQIQGNKLLRFFQDVPPHYMLLFADLNTSSQKEMAINFINENFDQNVENTYMNSMVENIRSYKIPTFAPPSQQKQLETLETEVVVKVEAQ